MQEAITKECNEIKNKIIIIINGKARSGKDTFINFCNTNFSLPIYNFSTVDTIKAVSKTYFNWDGKKTDKARKFLSNIKDAWTIFNDGPFEEIKYRINTFCKDGIVFIHAREPREIKKLKEFYGNKCITLLIRRSLLNTPDNYADQNVENLSYDYIISNNKGLKEFERKTIEFMTDLIKETT